MKKLFCLVLVLCLSVSLAFGEPWAIDIEKRNYIIERDYKLELLIPSFVFCGGAVWLFTEANREENDDDKTGIMLIACVLTFTSLIFLTEALRPRETFWFPRLEKDGTIWFEKLIEW